MAQPRTYVEAPPVTPRPFGLFSTALVLDDLQDTRAMGIEYEPLWCGPAYDSTGACDDPPDWGTLTISVALGGTATITATGYPTLGTYTIQWGEGAPVTTDSPDGESHAYGDLGDFIVTVSDDQAGYVASTSITVNDVGATGPFTGDISFQKIESAGIDLVTGDPFSVYHLFRCALVGLDQATMQARAQGALRLGEPRAVERVLGRLLAADAAAVDLTPTAGTPVEVVRGLGLLERHAGSFYGGLPVVHAPIDAVTELSAQHAVMRAATGTRLETVQAAQVAAGGGYDRLTGPGGVEAPEGAVWMWVTGQVVVHRSDDILVGPVMSRTPATNTASMLTERLDTVSWECIAGAVLVALEPQP
jgi:hypothetical protein